MLNGFIYTGEDAQMFESNMHINSVLRKFHNSSNVDKISEWFLNGPRNPIYTGKIAYNFTRKYVRSMEKPKYLAGLDNLNFNDLTDSFEGKTISYKDNILVTFRDSDDNEKSFSIQAVPDEFSPEWSKKVGIEYKSDWWIPDEIERKKSQKL